MTWLHGPPGDHEGRPLEVVDSLTPGCNGPLRDQQVEPIVSHQFAQSRHERDRDVSLHPLEPEQRALLAGHIGAVRPDLDGGIPPVRRSDAHCRQAGPLHILHECRRGGHEHLMSCIEQRPSHRDQWVQVPVSRLCHNEGPHTHTHRLMLLGGVKPMVLVGAGSRALGRRSA
jgi:hypothetical protein